MFKKISPLLALLSGLLLTLSFPFIGVKLIDYYYGSRILERPSAESVGASVTFHLYIIVSIILLVVLCYFLYLFFKKNYDCLCSKKVIFGSFAFPIIGYFLLIADIRSHQNLTAGMYVAIYHHDSMHLSRLISIGADVNSIHPNPKNITPLMMTALMGDKEIVQIVLDAGANKEVKNTTGETAVEIAEKKGYLEIAKMLQ